MKIDIRKLEKLDRWALAAQLIRDLRDRGGQARETQVQTAVFFLQEMLEVPIGYQFMLHKHGAHSPDLHGDLGAMLTTRVLDRRSQPPDAPSFGIGEMGEKLIGDRMQVTGQYAGRTNFIADALGPKDMRELERLGLALLVKLEPPDLDAGALPGRMAGHRPHRPHIPYEQALAAVREAERIEGAALCANLVGNTPGC